MEALEIDGFELSPGHGGGHYMTCPFLRDGI
ncbi:MAG: hypothetical protein ACK2T4_04930 [Candidatus Promineifilaceae bacterium]